MAPQHLQTDQGPQICLTASLRADEPARRPRSRLTASLVPHSLLPLPAAMPSRTPSCFLQPDHACACGSLPAAAAPFPLHAHLHAAQVKALRAHLARACRPSAWAHIGAQPPLGVLGAALAAAHDATMLAVCAGVTLKGVHVVLCACARASQRVHRAQSARPSGLVGGHGS